MKSQFKTAVASIALATACLAGANAGATTLSTAQALLDFNAIIYTNATTPSDIEGAAVIGGNFTGATVFSNANAPAAPSGFGALNVFGSNLGTVNIDNGGSAYVAGAQGTVNFNAGPAGPGHFITTPPPESITGFETTFNGLSTNLSKLSATTSVSETDLNNVVFNAVPGAHGVAVFNISSTQLDAIQGYMINLNGASSVIFNVTGGGAVNFQGNLNGFNSADASKIIWNFGKTTNVNISRQFAGTVLATNANVTNGNQIDGDLIANSFTGSGELHSFGFNGILPSDAPEPATWAVMLMGFGAVGAALRNSRRRLAA